MKMEKCILYTVLHSIKPCLKLGTQESVLGIDLCLVFFKVFHPMLYTFLSFVVLCNTQLLLEQVLKMLSGTGK